MYKSLSFWDPILAYFDLFWPSNSFKTPTGGTKAGQPLCFGVYKARVSPSLLHRLEPRASLRCRNLKVQKRVKNGHFWPLRQILSTWLGRGKRVERSWFVGLVHISCTCQYPNHIPFGPESATPQRVEAKKSRNFFCKKPKKIDFFNLQNLIDLSNPGSSGTPIKAINSCWGPTVMMSK